LTTKKKKPLKLNQFETPLADFVKKFDTHADAAAALGVHASAITQALQDVKQGKREVLVRNRREAGEFVAISVRYFGKAKQTTEGL